MYARIFFILLAVLSLHCSFSYAGDADNDLAARYKVEGFKYYTGSGRPLDMAGALRFYIKAAQLGDAEAQFIVGGMLYKGEGGAANEKEAFKWLLKAAENGKVTAESMQIIGSMYLRGVNVPQNYKEAKKWLLKSLVKGSLGATNDLAFMYYHGLDGERAMDKALELYTRAAMMGDTVAQANVGMMYATGTGTSIDTAQAYAWYSLAAAGGNTTARIHRNNLMAEMSWEELNRAQAISIKLYQEIERLSRNGTEEEEKR